MFNDFALQFSLCFSQVFQNGTQNKTTPTIPVQEQTFPNQKGSMCLLKRLTLQVRINKSTEPVTP